jgi:stage II sporulation protein R
MPLRGGFMLKRLLLVGILLFVCGFVYNVVASTNEISEKFVRFHIIANSDSEADQKIKMEIRNKIFEEFDFSGISSKSDALDYFNEHIKEIENLANKILMENNFQYSAKAQVVKKQFPIREYTNFTLPSGLYDAVSIELGEAKGKNFFCVMYPSLCLIEGVSEKTDGNIETLNNVLSENEVETITGDRNKVVVKLKIVEIFNKLVASK